jgi:molybdopterin/thiamine biosynthesis adenylyltransferase
MPSFPHFTPELDISRHLGLFNGTLFQSPIWIFGVGGSGSRIGEGLVCYGLGTVQSPIHLVDMDSFQPHNVPNQLATFEQGLAETPKVQAVRDNLHQKNPHARIRVHELEAPHEDLSEISGVVFLCLDSMEARQRIVVELLENNPQVNCVIDIRMDAGCALVYTFDPNDPFQVGCYFDEWYTDDEADSLTGCDDEHFSIIDAVYGAAMVGLRSFREFADGMSTHGMRNMVYLDFVTLYSDSETWTQPEEEDA